MPMPKRKRGSNASDASEKLVLDQCALFALQRVVSAVQDREVSSQEILGALRGAAKWALAHRHDKLSREEGREVLRALDNGESPPDPSIGLMAQSMKNLGAFFVPPRRPPPRCLTHPCTGCRLDKLDNNPASSDVRSAVAAPDRFLLLLGDFNWRWCPTSPLVGGELDSFEEKPAGYSCKHLIAKVGDRVFDTNLHWSKANAFRQVRSWLAGSALYCLI